MPITVKSAAVSGDKLVQAAQARATEYSANAQAAGDKQAAAVQASGANFLQAITAAGIKERYLKGSAKAGAAKYARKVREVGANRFSEGVAAGKQDYVANVEPYLSTIAGLTLTARQPRGSAGNYARVKAIGDALNAKRLAMLGSGA